MIIIDILKDACIQVKEQTKNLIGTAEGNKKFGVGAGGDISRMVDLIAEKAVMDTIDGTTNASRDIPFYCCSLAYATDNKLSSVVDAAIIDLVRGDLYYSSKNKGSYLNGNTIEIRKYVDNGNANESQKKDILIGMNISGASENVMNHISKIILKANHTR